MAFLSVIPERGGSPFRFDPARTNAVRLNAPGEPSDLSGGPWLFEWAAGWRLLVNRPNDIDASELEPVLQQLSLTMLQMKERSLAYVAAKPGTVRGVFMPQERAAEIVTILGTAAEVPQLHEELPLRDFPLGLSDHHPHPIIDPAEPPARRFRGFPHPVLSGRWVGPPAAVGFGSAHYPESEFAGGYADRYALRKVWRANWTLKDVVEGLVTDGPLYTRSRRGIDLYHDLDADRWVLVRGSDAGWPEGCWKLAKEGLAEVQVEIISTPDNRFREITPEAADGLLQGAGGPRPSPFAPDTVDPGAPPLSPASVGSGGPQNVPTEASESSSAHAAPPSAAVIAKSNRVTLYEGGLAAVDGREQKVRRAQFEVLKVLLDAHPKGLTKGQLEADSNHGGARNILYTLRKDDLWQKVIVLPGTKNGGGYRIL